MSGEILSVMAQLGGQYAAQGAHMDDGDDLDVLHDADPDCDHVIVDGDNWSGIKCSKCPGWYCA